MSELKRAEVVLHLKSKRGHSVVFGLPDDDAEGGWQQRDLWLDRADWEGFGSPPEITVTIVAGDRLSEEEFDALVAEAADSDLPGRQAQEGEESRERLDAQARLQELDEGEGDEQEDEEGVT